GGEAAELFLEKSARDARSGEVRDGDEVALASTEAGIGAFNMLGAWSDARNCYYFNDYDPVLDRTRYTKQTWTIESAVKGRPVRFGDTVAFRNKHSGAYLTPSENGVTTRRDAYFWIIEPIASPAAAPSR
ncbi:MAG TPA: hypothetical protein VL242_08200, partial [Sorangium sp.]|nr:hypothetical protein [Sorangium sp.]